MIQSFLDCFGAVVSRQGDRTAILSDGLPAFSYRELDERAKAIAVTLRRQGAGPEAVVGLCFEKSPEYVAALLGVWYSGAAFMPLDPKLPRERLAYMVTESSTSAVIAQAGCQSLFDGLPLTLVPADSIKSGSRERDSSPVFDTDQLAYIIFTSGSTGKPKGVMVTHSGIVNFLEAQIETFKLSSESRALFYHSHNFDASVSDIGTALLSGATVLIEKPELLLPGPEFAALLAARRVTHMDIPPAILPVLKRSDMPESLETIIIGGEVCPPPVVRDWSERFRVVNVYGPTEATVCTSLCVCEATSWDRPLIGKPVPGVTYRVLDEQLEPVRPGVPAELFIGGISLARGYANRPELTAEKFIVRAGERLYRTGDLVVEGEDGEIEFIGRVDRQVKVRGLLVEPEEIEARLLEHEGVKRVCVLKRPLSATSDREALVAFVEAHSGDHVRAETLRAHLSLSLPRWMLPQRYELLDALPLTVTGKVDVHSLRQRALPAPTGNPGPGGDLSPEARVVSEVWQQVLGLEVIELDDDFFELGGDSFAVIETVVAAETRGLTIPPALFMTHTRFGDQVKALNTVFTSDANSLAACGGMRCEVLRDDVRLNEEARGWLDSAARRTGEIETIPQNILLTGATGFLGTHVLVDVLERTGATRGVGPTLFCLVRADDPAQARQRIDQALARYGKRLSARQSECIVPVPGDIEKPLFGINDALEWSRLAETVDTVYHLAAHVNMLLPYEALRRANVGGTEQVVRFLLSGRKKCLHYASTLSVFVATDQNEGVAREDDYLDGTGAAYGGYAQTKWAAEVYLRSLGESAGPISYYRFGLITGDSATGVTSSTDFLAMFIRGISSVGCVPNTSMSVAVDVTPVDFAAGAMAHVSLSSMAAHDFSTYHVANATSLTVGDLVRCMRSFGTPVEEVPPDEFLRRISSSDSVGFDAMQAAACLALCRGLAGEHSFECFRTMDLFQATGIEFDMTNTNAALKGSGLVCPRPTDQLVLTYLQAIFPDR